MGQSKLKNSIILLVFIMLILGSFFYFNLDKYTYKSHLSQILGIKDVQFIDKNLTDSWALGEWYICETYDLSNENTSALIPTSNLLYSSDKNWKRKDWERLPIDSICNGAKKLVLDYHATDGLEKKIEEINNLLSAGSGYYSFLCQPSFEHPQKVVFFLLDERENRLFIVDLKL